MVERDERKRSDSTVSVSQHEDAALKTAMLFFSDELLPYFGIEGKVASIAPTELVHLDVKKMFQDFDLVMDDGTWKHFEFQSTNEGIEGLKRFRVYEALTSYQYKVEVTTYVLFSGGIKNPVMEFTEGVNTYRVIPIIMQSESADSLIRELQEKVKRGEEITRQELIPLTLCLLMGGEMSLKDRVNAAFGIMQKAVTVNSEDIRKVEAVLYVMADKFLDSMSMEEVMEGIRMTKLGQMLVDKGKEEGREEGREAGAAQEKMEIARNLIGLLDEQVIAERTGLTIEMVHQLKKEKNCR